ncbi:hypothetical protein LTR74_018878, partial [Friedmanniomyces endolithicus]
MPSQPPDRARPRTPTCAGPEALRLAVGETVLTVHPPQIAPLSNKRSQADPMLATKQERAFDDDVARSIHHKDVELKLVRNNDPATTAVTGAKLAMK